MEITIDPDAGFCIGVTRAIRMAEEAAKKGPVATLGDIVHNPEEVQRLKNKGIGSVTHTDLPKMQGSVILLRAHGEPPSTYETAQLCDLNLIDATCPIVAGVQKKIKKAYKEALTVNGQIAIYGKPGHPETIGLKGQTENTAIVISETADLDTIDYNRPLWLFAQTTMQPAKFSLIAGEIRKRFIQAGRNPDEMLRVSSTICRYVSGREAKIREFARRFDVIVFVSGANSSNGNYLYSCCKEENPRSYFVSHADELKKEWFAGASSAGISGATSTPQWLMEEVKNRMMELEK